MEWKNTPDLYNDYIHFEEAPKAMATIIQTYGWFFDDQFFYWTPKRRNQIIKRRPLYWFPQKSTPTEKHTAKEHPRVPINQWK